jgi:hypothetical protein
MEFIELKQIILGGLSHGCAMALSLMLCLDITLGGVIGMSGWLSFERDMTDHLNSQLDPINDDSTEEGVQSTSCDVIVEALQMQRDALSIECNNTDKIKTTLSTPVFIGH